MARLGIVAGLLLASAGAMAQTNSDWPTWGFDGQRSGWNKDEAQLTKKNVSRMKLLWSVQLPTKVQATALSTLTAPIVIAKVATAGGDRTLVFTIDVDDTIYAVDAENGNIVWQKAFPNTLTPLRHSTVNCSNTEQATPTVDQAKGVIYFTTSDGKLHGLALADGASRLAPVDMVAPFSRNWSLNFADNVVYTAAGRGCGGSKAQPIEPGHVSAVDVTDPDRPALSRYYTGVSRPAGPWGAGGPVLGPQGLYAETADGPNNPGGGVHGNAIVAVRPHAWGLADSFVPPNWRYLNAKDLDLGSSGPVIFDVGKRSLVAAGAKEGVVYLLDATNMGGQDHATAAYTSPRLGNDDQTYWGHGIWGGISTYQNAAGERYIYVPMWGAPAKDGPHFPKSYGDTPHGSIMAFKVTADDKTVSMEPAWMSRDLDPPAPPAIANGMVFALQQAEHTSQHPNNPEGHGRAAPGTKPPTEAELGVYRTTPDSDMALFVLDAETGKELWSSRKAMAGNTTHFSEPVVAAGKVFVVDHNAHIFGFGLKR